jgi:hypothetical protein
VSKLEKNKPQYNEHTYTQRVYNVYKIHAWHAVPSQMGRNGSWLAESLWNRELIILISLLYATGYPDAKDNHLQY